MTNQPHREWIYRQAYHMGRHVIGYEVQKVLAAVDWIEAAGPIRRQDRGRRLRRGRPDRLLRRGRRPADRRRPGQRLLRPARARLGRSRSTATSGACSASSATLRSPPSSPRARWWSSTATAPSSTARPPVPEGRRGGAAVGCSEHAGHRRRPRASGIASTRSLPEGFQHRPLIHEAASRLTSPAQRPCGQFVALLGVATHACDLPEVAPSRPPQGLLAGPIDRSARSGSWRTTSRASSATPTPPATPSFSTRRR